MLPPRLLAQEEIEVLDGACKPRKVVITRHGLDHEVSGLLKRGITSTSAGGFFFIPYLLQLGSHGLLGSWGPAKPEGIPKERIGLGIVFGGWMSAELSGRMDTLVFVPTRQTKS